MNAEIKQLISDNRKKDRPLSLKSVSAYASTLSTLYKNAFDTDGGFNSANFNNYKHILQYLSQFESSRRKTILASLMTVATDETALSEYRKLMLKDAKHYDDDIAKNKMTDKFRDSWITPKELDELGNTLRNKWVELYKKYMSSEPLTIKEKQQMQEYIIYLLTSGRYGLPPRRLLDWTEMKIESYDARKKQQQKLNYNIYEPKKKQFIFSRFKTDDTFNRQIIKAPPYIEQYLSIWISLLEKGFTQKTLHKPSSPYLLTDTKNRKLSPITLNQRMNKIYGEGRSVNSLRHSYITSRYKDMPSVKDMQDTATKMGHSVRTALTYIKK
jgi:hypothetical protein